MTDTHLNEIAAIIRRAKAEAYEQGKADAKREMLTYLTTDAAIQPPVGAQPKGANAPPPAKAKPRVHTASRKPPVPRGTPEKLIRRALSSHPGLTAVDILAQAASSVERLIHPQSLRNELIRGRAAGRYRDEDNRWYLTDTGKDEAEGNPLQDRPSASSSSQGGSDDRTALDSDLP